MAPPTDVNRTKALDLGSNDWTWLYELAFWLGPDGEVTDHSESVPIAQATLLSLLDAGLAEIAEVDGTAQSYHAVSVERARRVVNDPESWRTAHDLNEAGSPVLFAYAATEKGRQLYFDGGAV